LEQCFVGFVQQVSKETLIPVTKAGPNSASDDCLKPLSVGSQVSK